ncbi:unnamed protein product [Spodoptera littoralis]|uniref:Uncharacterized protein n=1 Tax=Spodoptera littoralis TaxID=7109 RepID=A0A9P0N921_SPOLI|nr:unnamed protein product [Spodoptera littoralis]
MLAESLFMSILLATSLAIKLAYEPINYGRYSTTYQRGWMDAAIAIVELNMLEDQPGVGVPTLHGMGVAIDYNRVLTSYNAMRRFVLTKGSFEKAYVVVLKGRSYDANNRTFHHDLGVYKILCGRQPVHVDNIPDHLWFDKEHQTSPYHDLFVLRIDANLTKKLNAYQHKNTGYVESGINEYQQSLEGLYLNLVNPVPQLEGFLEIGFYYYRENRPKVHEVRLSNTTFSTKNIRNCDSVLPRYWGYFICVEFSVKYRLLSGALLLLNGDVAGIGSHQYFTEVANRMVAFTDVRPYRFNLFYACSELETSGTAENPVRKWNIEYY